MSLGRLRVVRWNMRYRIKYYFLEYTTIAVFYFSVPFKKKQYTLRHEIVIPLVHQ